MIMLPPRDERAAEGDAARRAQTEDLLRIREHLAAAQADIATARGQVDWLAAHLARLLVAWHDLDGTATQRVMREVVPDVCAALDALDGDDEEDGEHDRTTV